MPMTYTLPSTVDPTAAYTGRTVYGDNGPGQIGTATPTYGNFGQAQAQLSPGGDKNQSSLFNSGKGYQAPQINLTPEYGDYENFGTVAQQYGAAGGQALNSPDLGMSMNALGYSAAGQNAGQRNEVAANGMLQSAAAGQVPSAADLQMQSGLQQAQANSMAQAASTRGNFGLANAQKQAQGSNVNLSQGALAQGTINRANEQAAARGEFAQSSNAQANNLGQAAAAYSAGAQGQEGQALGYYGGQQQNYMNQAGLAAQLGSHQADLYAGQNTAQQQYTLGNDANTREWAQMGANAVGSTMAAMSDERAKTEIHSADTPIFAQLEHFHPESFRYRNPADAPNPEGASAPHLGVIAQDVERGPAGATLVRHAPDGRLMLDTNAMVGTLAAGAGALKRRTDDHEGRLARLESLLGGRA